MPASPQPQQIIALVVRHNTPGVEEPVSRIRDFLAGAGYRVVFEADTAANLALDNLESMTVAEIGVQAQIGIVVGGDGTMLGIARQLAEYDIALIGINLGRLGFITDIALDDMLPQLSNILQGRARREERTLLEGARHARWRADLFQRGRQRRGRGARHGRRHGRTQTERRRSIHVQPALGWPDRLHAHRLDGVRAVGRRAIAASEPGRHVLVPIAPHALSNRPIVVPDTSEIVVELVSGRDISVNFDMQTFASLQQGDQIVISRSPHTITFLHPLDWSYYHTLREKLHWNEYPTNDGRLK